MSIAKMNEILGLNSLKSYKWLIQNFCAVSGKKKRKKRNFSKGRSKDIFLYLFYPKITISSNLHNFIKLMLTFFLNI